MRDTLIDIAGYAILALIVERGKWKKEMDMGDFHAQVWQSEKEIEEVLFARFKEYGAENIADIGFEGIASRLTDKLARLKQQIKK